MNTNTVLKFLGHGAATFRQLCAHFDVEDSEARHDLHQTLKQLCKRRLVSFRKGLYSSASRKAPRLHGPVPAVTASGSAVMEGRVSVHPSGFGFVSVPGLAEDVFLPPDQLGWVMDGDEVRVTPRYLSDGRTEGRVLEVTHHARKNVVGLLFHEHRQIFIRARNRGGGDISIPENACGGAEDGQWVVCEITRYPDQRRSARGRVIRVLGGEINVHLLSEAALFEFSIPHVWPDDIDAELHDFPDIAATLEDSARRDLRDLPLVTIDGESAQDFDDAVYAAGEGEGWRLVVAIADVSEYVAPGGPLDLEALKRGNSVYFPRRVVPMLPEILSNELCSLKPAEDRLALACDMRVSSQGKLSSFCFYPALIRSHARLNYDKVFAYMQGDSEPPAPLRDTLGSLVGVFRALRAARMRRGALDLDISEVDFAFDDEGRVSAITSQMRNDAHRLIEECMLAANCCAAEFIGEQAPAAVYRVHDQPAAEKVEELREFLLGYGVYLSGGAAPAAEDFSRMLAHPELNARQLMSVRTMILRSLAQARYTAKNSGHFALASDAYTHFTSPIRRYPDLLVHRIIKTLLRRQQFAARLADGSLLEEWAQQCSVTERRAEQATRDVAQRLKVQYMEDKIGESFRGVVTGVTGFGLFVELEEALVSGLIHISAIGDDYYHYDGERHQLKGERSGRCFSLGDEVEVEVSRISTEQGKIELQMAGTAGRGHRKWSRPQRPARRRPRRGA